MGIGIIGAGSIGMLIGSYIAGAGLDVTLLVRKESQRTQLNTKGIWRMRDNQKEVVTQIHATTQYIDVAQVNLLIIAVKYKDLAEVLARLKEERIKVPVLFIQNGIGHLNDVCEKEFPNAAFATVEHGALKTSDYIVKHNGVGAITIGVPHGDDEAFKLMNRTQQQDFPIRWHEDAAYVLLRKTLINCLINPLTTILNVSNGMLLENPNSYQLMRNLYEELMYVFPQMRANLPFEAIENVCRQTAKNDSSMLMDYRYGRPMEIDTIVSAVIQRAERKGEKLPLLQTYEQLLRVLDRKATEE